MNQKSTICASWSKAPATNSKQHFFKVAQQRNLVKFQRRWSLFSSCWVFCLSLDALVHFIFTGNAKPEVGCVCCLISLELLLGPTNEIFNIWNIMNKPVYFYSNNITTLSIVLLRYVSYMSRCISQVIFLF